MTDISIRLDQLPPRTSLTTDFSMDHTKIRFTAHRLHPIDDVVIESSQPSGWFEIRANEPIHLTWTAFEWGTS
jgi:hypothetical protein